ncbi:MAG: hypothetical protein ABJH07_05315 [Sedimentitalea sp.]|uniref:hypothetical protein n=1 Tax=Sedimentitalea sp. TaxID=2048915 RepID=UPI003266125C
MTAAATDVPAAKDTLGAGRFVYTAGIILLCGWVRAPNYFLAINTLSSPETVNSFLKPFSPEFDLGSLTLFTGFAGMLLALKNSILVASMTMIVSIPIGAPAGMPSRASTFAAKRYSAC